MELNGATEEMEEEEDVDIKIQRTTLKMLRQHSNNHWKEELCLRWRNRNPHDPYSCFSSLPQVHFFNSFFYDKLRTKGYDGVKRWTKNVSFVRVDFLVVLDLRCRTQVSPCAPLLSTYSALLRLTSSRRICCWSPSTWRSTGPWSAWTFHVGPSLTLTLSGPSTDVAQR